MNKPKLAFGLNLAKKPGASKPLPRKKSMFDDDDSHDESEHNHKQSTEITQDIGGDFDDVAPSSSSGSDARRKKEPPRIAAEPPKLKAKSSQNSAMFGDLSSSLTSRKHAESAAEVDGNVYEYDAVYDSMRPKRTQSKEDEQRKPKYMRSLMQAAEVRKRDSLIAEEKKIARERAAEGDEFAGKEKFVTEAYKKQQEENRRIEEQEKRREEEEARKNKGAGMAVFYRKVLDRDEERHAETVKAAATTRDTGSAQGDEDGSGEGDDKEEAERARELNDKGAEIAVNEDGQVVDKRQLLRGGLNVGAKKKMAVEREAAAPAERERREGGGMRFDRKQAMRERQTRMIEEQLEQTLKRSREEEQARREEVEKSAKSRKTEGEISSAKERYLARKRAAEEEKKNAQNAAG